MTGSPSRPKTKAAHGGAFRRILVGFDLAEDSEETMRTAFQLANIVGGVIRILLVVRPHAGSTAHDDLVAQVKTRWERTAHEWGRRATDIELPPVDIRLVVSDDPIRALADHAEEHGFDLVVVGARQAERRTFRGRDHALDSLLLHHPCPVLVV